MGFEHVIPQFVLRIKEIIKNNKSKKIDFKIQGNGNETRSFCFIDDFTEGLIALEKEGKHLNIYHIGTEDEVSIKSVAEEVGIYFKKNLNIIPGDLAKGGTLRRCPDISKMKKIGYNPRTKLKEGISITADWYINQHRRIVL